MPYAKYKKIKVNSKSKTQNSDLQNVDQYVDDDEKTEDKNQENDSIINDMQDISDYVENEMKTVNPDNMNHLVSVINCLSPDTFVRECRASEQLYHSHKSEGLNPGQKANEGYHIIISCKGRDTDPELVHHAGIDVARELCGDEFTAKVCTHLNTDNYHNHIVINAYNIYGTRKFKDEWHLYKKIRRISDEISLKYGFSIIQEGLTDKQNPAEYLEQNGMLADEKALLSDIKQDIRECANAAPDFGVYKAYMQDRGYTLVESKNRITYIKDGIAVSDHRLGSRYSPEGIRQTIQRNQEAVARKAVNRKVMKATKKQTAKPNIGHLYVPRFDGNGRRIPGLIRLLLLIKQYILRIGDTYFDSASAAAFPENIKTQSAEFKAAKIDEIISLCEKYQIRTLAGLTDKLKEAGLNAKASDYEAIRLYACADRIADDVSTLKLEPDLEKLMRDLGLSNSDFHVKFYSDIDIRKNISAIDPMTGGQKKQLYNALNASDYCLREDSFSLLSRSDADKILDFLNQKTAVMPDTLISKSDYEIQKVKEFIHQKSKERTEMLAKKYGLIPATKSQIKMIFKHLPQDDMKKIDVNNLTKDQAIRLITRIKKPDFKAATTATLNQQKPTSWMLSTLNQLKQLYPDDFTTLPIDRLDKQSANNIINYYLAQNDDILNELYHSAEDTNIIGKESAKRKKINYSHYTDEQILCINEYRHLLDIKAHYGLNTSNKVNDFIAYHDALLSQADTLSVKSRQATSTYRELNYIRNSLKNITTKPFIFGTLYGGDDKETREATTVLTNQQIDRLEELSNQLDDMIAALSDQTLTSIDIRDPAWEPLSPAIRSYLTELNRLLPNYIHIDNPDHLSAAEAYNILSDVKYRNLLKAKIQKQIKQESKDQWEEEKAKEQRR